MVLKKNDKGPGKVMEFCQADSMGTVWAVHIVKSKLRYDLGML